MVTKDKTMDELHEEFKILGLSYKDFKENLGQTFSDIETIELFKLMLNKISRERGDPYFQK